MNIIEGFKSATELIQKIDNIELYRKILDLQSEAMGLVDQNNVLKEENKELKEKLKIKDNLVYRNNVYWLRLQEGTEDGPFCSRCWDVDNKLVRHAHLLTNFYVCPQCNMSVRS